MLKNKKLVIGTGIIALIALAFCFTRRQIIAPNPISTGILKTANNEYKSVNTEETFDLINIIGKGYVSMIWMAMTGGSNQLDSILNVYIDGETKPSISTDIGGLCSGHLYSGQFSAERLGTMINGTSNMAFYFNFPIPYSKSIRITVTAATGGTFWSQVYYNDGGEMLGRMYSSCQPFATAPEIQPNKRQTLLNTSGRGKIVFIQQTLVPTSPTLRFLEGNHRFFIDGKKVMESSGTEDFYLSGFYFARGTFVGPHVGCVSRSNNFSGFRDMHGSNTTPTFNKSIIVDWQNGEPAHATSYPTKAGYLVLYYLY